MKRLVPTAEMTLGPFFPREFAQGANQLAAGKDAIAITGRVTELDGTPLDNVVIEIWQADAKGRYDNPEFFGWGRTATDAKGVYTFRTLKPGSVDGQPPHINFLLLYSGLMRQLHTAMFFDDVKPQGNVYRFDIRLRGEGETRFFDDG